MKIVKSGFVKQVTDDKNNIITVSLRNCTIHGNIFQRGNAHYMILRISDDDAITNIEKFITNKYTLEDSPFDIRQATLLVKVPFKNNRYECLFYDKNGYETTSFVVEKGKTFHAELVFGGIWANSMGYSWKISKLYEC